MLKKTGVVFVLSLLMTSLVWPAFAQCKMDKQAKDQKPACCQCYCCKCAK